MSRHHHTLIWPEGFAAAIEQRIVGKRTSPKPCLAASRAISVEQTRNPADTCWEFPFQTRWLTTSSLTG
jgi:hypothetical protein